MALAPSSLSSEQPAPPAGGKSRPSQTGRRKLSLSQSRFLSGALPSPLDLLTDTNKTGYREIRGTDLGLGDETPKRQLCVTAKPK